MMARAVAVNWVGILAWFHLGVYNPHVVLYLAYVRFTSLRVELVSLIHAR